MSLGWRWAFKTLSGCPAGVELTTSRMTSQCLTNWAIVLKVSIQLKENSLILGSRFATVVWVCAFYKLMARLDSIRGLSLLVFFHSAPTGFPLGTAVSPRALQFSPLTENQNLIWLFYAAPRVFSSLREFSPPSHKNNKKKIQRHLNRIVSGWKTSHTQQPSG